MSSHFHCRVINVANGKWSFMSDGFLLNHQKKERKKQPGGRDHLLYGKSMAVRVIEWSRVEPSREVLFRNRNNWNGMVWWSSICVIVKNHTLAVLWAPESSFLLASSLLRDLMLIMIHTPSFLPSPLHLSSFIRFIILFFFAAALLKLPINSATGKHPTSGISIETVMSMSSDCVHLFNYFHSQQLKQYLFCN